MSRAIATFKVTSASGQTKGTYEVYRRTFEAKKFPVGSPERIILNKDNITSEYMTSHKFAVHGPHLSASYRTKDDAITRARVFAGA